MPQPTQSQIQAVDPVLTNLLIGYMQADDRFQAMRVFPPVPVEKDSGTYYIMTKKYWFLDDLARRAYGDKFARSGYGVSTSTYATQQWGLEHPIAVEDRANSQVPMDLEQVGLRWLAQQSLIRKERAFASDFMSTSAWTTNTSTSNKWSDYAASDPVGDVRTSQRTVSQLTGLRPNVMLMGEIVDDRLQNHPDIIDRVKYVQAATAGNIENAMADVFGLDQYLVSRAIYNSANEGQTFSGSAIIDDDALICYVDASAGVFGATAGKTFVWGPGGGQGAVAPMYFENQTKSDILQHSEQWDQKVTAADLGDIRDDVVD